MMLIVDLFPEQLSIRGDRGNAIALKTRANLSDYDLNIFDFHPGDSFPNDAQGVLIGSGADYFLEDMLDEINRILPDLNRLKENNKPILAISNGFKLMSESFFFNEREYKGAGIYPVACKKVDRRVGEVVIRSIFGDLIGFENHDIETCDNKFSLGMEQSGHGFFSGNLLACCLHGAFLPLNPKVADWFLNCMGIRVKSENLQKIDFYCEMARKAIKKRIR